MGRFYGGGPGDRCGGQSSMQFKPELISTDCEVADEGSKQILQNYMTELHAFIVCVLPAMPRNI